MEEHGEFIFSDISIPIREILPVDDCDPRCPPGYRFYSNFSSDGGALVAEAILRFGPENVMILQGGYDVGGNYLENCTAMFVTEEAFSQVTD